MYPHPSFFISTFSARLLQNCRLSLLRLEKKNLLLDFFFSMTLHPAKCGKVIIEENRKKDFLQ